MNSRIIQFINTIKNTFLAIFNSTEDKTLLSAAELFNHLSKKQFKKLCLSAIKVEYKSGEFIFNEGDIGDAFYIIKKGDIRIFTHGSKNEVIVLARLTAGNYFGEQALLEETPGRRNASVSAITDVSLLKIPHVKIIELLHVNKKLTPLLKSIGKEQLIKKLVGHLPMLHSLPDSLLKRLKGNIHEFSDKTVIFSKGDKSDYVYFLITGKVDIYLSEEKTSEITVKVQPGQFFGELGILKNARRAGTAITQSPAKLLVIDGGIFYDLYWAAPKFRAWVKTMQHIFKIPGRGVVTTTKTTVFNLPAIKVKYEFDHRVVIASQVIGKNIFTMMQSGEVKDAHIFCFKKNDSLIREITIVNNKLVGIMSIGQWDHLGYVCNLLLENTDIELWQIKLFQIMGELNNVTPVYYADNDETLCFCMNINYGIIRNAISNGINDFGRLSVETGAGSVCGACRYKINELLGNTAWSMAYVDKIISFTPDIRTYQLKLYQKKLPLYQAGQHIVIQILINKVWVERPYTLISIPENRDYYEVLIKQEPHGYFSSWLFANDTHHPLIRISQPQGKFTFDLQASEPGIFFAGGVGIAPAIAFARSLAKNRSDRRLHIDYSAYTSQDLVYSEELLTIARQYPNFSIYFRATNQKGIIAGKDIVKIIEQFPKANYYICGHEAYQAALTNALKIYNISSNRIITEIFVHAHEV